MPNTLNFKRDHYCEEDQLGRDKYINILAKMIQEEDFDTPFCIGIFGKWGSGKTSFMRQLERKLEQQLEETPQKPVPITVWFNPWRYEKEEHLIVPFLKTIEKELRSKSKNLGRDIKSLLENAAENASRAARAIAYGAKIKFFGMADFSASEMIQREKELKDEQKDELLKLAESLPSIYYDITTHLKETVSQKEFRLVVFIDDLDRCLPEKCVELLESIKLFLDLEGYLFVIGVDKEVVEQGIRHHYRFYNLNDYNENHNDKNGNRIISPDEYLDKMVQMPLELPPMEPTRKIKFISTLLGESYQQQALMIEAGIEDNPRTITRFVNYLAFMGRLAETLKKDILEEEESPGRPDGPTVHRLIHTYFTASFYVKWAIIVFSFPEVYRQIKNKKQHIFDLQNAAREKENGKPGVGSGDSFAIQDFPEGLKKVLAMDEPFPEESWLINKFIHLSASVGIAVSEKKASSSSRLSDKDGFKATGYVVESSLGDSVTVKKGVFLYGYDKTSRSIDYDYEIDIYPVTNEQYKKFIDADGYSEKKYWSKAGWTWQEKERKAEPRFWQDKKWNKDEHPIVGVCYFEAEAFAAWAGKRLPTEEEWERAARGDNGLLYPWGDEFDKELCNTAESANKMTTPVTRYPQGKSPYGCMDMAGNVWEWTVSDFDDGRKVLRGGSWNNNRDFARCAARIRFNPILWNDNVGFRCARTLP